MSPVYLLLLFIVSNIVDTSTTASLPRTAPLPPCPFDSTHTCLCDEDHSTPNTYYQVLCQLRGKSFPKFTGPTGTYTIKQLIINNPVHDLVMPANAFLPLKTVNTMTINSDYSNPKKMVLDPTCFSGPQISELYLDPFANTFPLPEAIVNLGTQGLQTLSISAGNSVALGANMFQTFRNLNTLYITDTPVVSVDDLAFAGLEDSLTSLYLILDKISTYPATAIKRLVNLERLQLTGNGIKSFSRAAFAPLTKLRLLDLSQNYLQSAADAGAFDQLPTSLHHLNLAFGGLTKIPGEIFESAPGISILYLDHNNITAVRHDDFAKSTGLTELYLQYNPIETIEPNAFSSLKLTQTLGLYNTNLKSIDFSSFDGMTELAELSMCCQATLKDVTISSLDTLSTKFNKIDLSETGLRVIDPSFKSIVDLPHFYMLILSVNPSIECNEDMQWIAPYSLCWPYKVGVDGSKCGNIPGKTVEDYLSESVPNPCKQ